MISGIQVELKPLRKNGKNAHYIVLELKADGSQAKTTYYESMREAIYHAILNQNGDILAKGYGKSNLKAFYCQYSKAMRFGFGASEWERSTMLRDFWWASFDQSKLQSKSEHLTK